MVQIQPQEPVNEQTTSYAFQTTDNGKLVTFTNTGTITGTVPQAGSGGNFLAGWYADVQMRGTGTLLLEPQTSTLDGSSTCTLTQNQGLRFCSDGTNYYSMRGVGGAGGGGGGGLADPGANGIIKRTALDVTAIATATDYFTTVYSTTTLQGTWSALSTAYYTPAAALDVAGQVHFCGGYAVTTFTNGSEVAVLPTNMWPSKIIAGPVFMNDNTESTAVLGQWAITTNGQLFVYTSTSTMAGHNVSFFMDGIVARIV